MDYKELKQAVKGIASKGLEERKNWYSPAAEAYNSTRPKYPSELVGKAVSAAKLSSSSRILEIGSGPGTATTAFAELGCRMVCIEPNPDFCNLARMNCKSYSTVEVINKSFDEWNPEPKHLMQFSPQAPCIGSLPPPGSGKMSPLSVAHQGA